MEFTAPTDSAYSREYPIRAEYIEDGFIDGCNHLVTVAVYPVGYSPEQEMLTVASSVAVTLEYESCSASELTSTPLFPPVRSRYLDLESMVVNPSKASSPNYAPRKKATAQLPEYYYIITPRNLEKAFGDLAVWKRQKGYNVIVKCIEDICADPRYKIGSTYSVIGADSAEHVLDSAMSLRCYLKDQYVLNGHFFCLLAGDWRTPMPIRKFTTSHFKINTSQVVGSCDKVFYANNCEEAVPADIYFANPTKNYKLDIREPMSIYTINKDSVDFNFSISVGRLLCATPKEVQNYTHKLIMYEGNPGYGDNDYLSSAVFFEGCGKEWKPGEFKHTNCILGTSKDIREKCDFFDDITLYQDQYHLQSVADPSVIDPSAVTPEVADGPSANEIIRKINQTGFSGWYAHGTPYGVMCGAKGHVIYSDDRLIGNIPYENEDSYKRLPNAGLNNLSNKYKPSVIFSISCDVAPFDVFTWDNGFRFDDINLGRSVTTEGEYGCVGALMNTRNGHRGLSSSLITNYSDGIQSIILDYVKNHVKIGMALRNGVNEEANYKHDAMTLNLIGEPEFEMWLGKPKNFEIQLIPSVSGVSIEGSVQDSTYYVLSNVNSTSAKLPLTQNTVSPIFPGEYCFSIWKSGYLPIITLFGQQGTLSESKRYVVRNAVLGNTDESSSAGYTIQEGGILSVRAIDSISTYSGFTVENGGVAELSCDQNVTINGGVVKSGGCLTIRAKNVKFNPGFKVEEGGILKIENN